MRFFPVLRRLRFWTALVAVLVLPAVARADVQACVDAHSEAQLKRDESDFLAARELFGRCVDMKCPEPIRVECAALLSKLDQSMPSVVLSAQDERGNDVPDVKVEVDDKPYLDALSGRATAVNPGSHRFAFVRPDGSRTSVTALVLEGVKGRAIVGRFGAAAGAAAEAQRPKAASSRKTLAYVLGGAGVVALGAFGYFALSGKSELDDLRAGCAPSCSDAQASSVSAKYLLADISLVAAAGLLGSGAYLYFSAPSGPRAEQALGARLTGSF
jgi:hypothetical protein